MSNNGDFDPLISLDNIIYNTVYQCTEPDRYSNEKTQASLTRKVPKMATTGHQD